MTVMIVCSWFAHFALASAPVKRDRRDLEIDRPTVI
jgi:hypothetical protein